MVWSGIEPDVLCMSAHKTQRSTSTEIPPAYGQQESPCYTRAINSVGTVESIYGYKFLDFSVGIFFCVSITYLRPDNCSSAERLVRWIADTVIEAQFY